MHSRKHPKPILIIISLFLSSQCKEVHAKYCLLLLLSAFDNYVHSLQVADEIMLNVEILKLYTL